MEATSEEENVPAAAAILWKQRERERELEQRNASLERTEGEEEVRGGQGRTGEEPSG